MTTRVALVGTAQSWVRTPWNDPSLRIVSLNDAYALGLPRVDEWYELHPLDHMVFRKPTQRVVEKGAIPPGYYMRPQGHIEWLQKQAATIPVWLQNEPPAGWPSNAQRMPVEALDAKYGAYWASGPAYILMHLYERGFREFQIYGIHLATEHEYREQRPNFEMILGQLLGPEKSLSVERGLRTYKGANGVTVVLPVESPILQHGWRYAYEPKPQPQPNPYAAEMKAVRAEKAALVEALVQWPKGKDKTREVARLQRLTIIEIDIQQQLAKLHVGGTLTAKIAA